jgi:hypothetical protein
MPSDRLNEVEYMNKKDERFLENMINGVKVMDGMEMASMTVKLNGVVLRKAEFEGNLSRVYSKVFERMMELEIAGNEDITGILGERGG